MKCRGCGHPVGPSAVIADEQEWVEDEDDVGYPYHPACVAEIVARSLRWSSMSGANTPDSSRTREG